MSTLFHVMIDAPGDDRYHVATVSALAHAIEHAGIDADIRIVRTPEIAGRTDAPDGVWIGPSSPYDDMEAAIALIRRCREEQIPTIAT